MTKSTKPKKNWIEELKLFDKQQAKSNADYYKHTYHITDLKDIDYINLHKNKGNRKQTKHYED